MTLKLVLGSRNYSSWSLRPWLAMKSAAISFEETVLPIYLPGARQAILAFSPSGKVPVLLDGDLRIWESLAIIEYVAEKFPAAGLWPQDAAERAHARAIANEMHGGFHTYRIAVGAPARDYMEAVMNLPAWSIWAEAAAVEPWVLPEFEITGLVEPARGRGLTPVICRNAESMSGRRPAIWP